MAATLQEILLPPDIRQDVIADCNSLIKQQVSDMSGISGAAVKLAYRSANSFAPGHVTHIIDTLLPKMTEQLQPFWADFTTSGGSEFGDYLSKRDFDQWYQSWYLATVLRAPFLSVILMILVLEFVEWYGEGTWIETYLLEEGNKSYFIAFMSFCIGLSSDQAAAILRDLSWSISDFLRGVVQRVSRKLSSALLPANPLDK